MAKINNIVKMFEFKDENDLFWKLDRYMSTDRSRTKESKAYRVKDIKLIDEHRVMAYLEEDLNVLQVRFFNSNGEELLPLDEPHTEEYMTFQELQFLSDLGSITFEEMEYEIDEIKYEINSYGTRSVNVYLI
ncbi:MAG: hypothetical protein [Bacteriophage sp.]|jgi:hypothetical protein|nr:MAG: hypothetical protein [Bacteriophage sp.]UVX32639.1 MAG: hypothetical protein [Bacteriophage sp.]UVX84051.1 MAG: hypothetical protein [Bacteriophage sp.]UWI15970.1 MAG: hypothetical protein [Bacteriophage sp.]